MYSLDERYLKNTTAIIFLALNAVLVPETGWKTYVFPSVTELQCLRWTKA